MGLASPNTMLDNSYNGSYNITPTTITGKFKNKYAN